MYWTCGLYYQYEDDCPESALTLCNDCSRIFKNAKCSAAHKKLRKNGKSYFGELSICELCGILVSILQRKDPDTKTFAVRYSAKRAINGHLKIFISAT